jgi:hypothetical protein
MSNTMLKGADALVGIRFEHPSGEAALIAALSAFEGICAGEQRDTVISASGARYRSSEKPRASSG